MASRFAGLPPVAGIRAVGGPPADAVVSLRMADGGEASFPLRQVQGRQVIAAVPWRKRAVPAARPTTRATSGRRPGGHVIYESRLELARLLLADFDRDVTAIAAQPFLLQARVAGRLAGMCRTSCWRTRTSRCWWSTSSRPASSRTRGPPRRWPGRGGWSRRHGWEYEIWSGADPVLLANVRFLAGYRRPGLLPETLLDDVLGSGTAR